MKIAVEDTAGETGQSCAVRLFERHRRVICRQTDRLFATTLVFEWTAGLVTALIISPRAWSGAASSVHVHVWAALFLGGAIVSLPVILCVIGPVGS